METLKLLMTGGLMLVVIYMAPAQDKLYLRPEGLTNEVVAELKKGKLRAIIAANGAYGQEHRAGYNGVAELYHPAQDSSPFVPFYAGLNLEHIFSNVHPDNIFEPRKHDMQLVVLGKNEATLYQPPTPQSKTESLTTFQLNGPHYIDMTFQFVVHDLQYFQEGFAGIFWASYINAPPDRKIYFKGKEGDSQVKWIASFSEKHGENSTHRSMADTKDFGFSDDYPLTLVNHFSDYAYESPWYYGRFHNMVLAYMFEGDGVVRLSQSPTGGGGTNPAWDFQYIVPEVKTGHIYTLHVRLIYKEFKGREDIEKEYGSWQKRPKG